MRSSLVSSTLLSIIAWMARAYANNGPLTKCCLGHSTTRVRLDQIQNYTVQTDRLCDIPAIVFFTEKGLRICSSPNSDWSKRAMGKVDKEKRGLGEVERKEEKRGLGEVERKEEKRGLGEVERKEEKRGLGEVERKEEKRGLGEV
ncbi:C-C motif chemokine 4-like, partial [Hypomesus transpacificus]|uniref:C-C motif chemokine 4-like n=1 Tax=Hypomesus transpacificus TaxID=137520 RepID=UPI001F07D7A9